ncbi:SIR2 family NAD-dependent protein deacylase [Desulfobotulus mexicanus]|uniref:protein acetyllysine N-acetyltransferase n=1 Tax=Desulfobotulus mexicanus TaxID=2586642 RepID=A0A5Q4VF71_9BACT|nr:NAD-dependent deacylase [Desulfobotulus mexicanus]TYT74912.1 NAD-dependent deacylase [Desulfobotulus mexicanus]
MEISLEKAAELLKKSRNTVALTGAGISVESGIPPFRGKGGLWETMDPMEFAHIRAFRNNPEKVWDLLLRTMKDVLEKARPNPAHHALADMEKTGKLEAIITQNIDGLHQAAGNKKVIEFHGSFARIICTDCHRSLPIQELFLEELPPLCTCGGILRPDCVFFGENIPEDALYTAQEYSISCDLMLVIGTSAEVWPAADLPRMAKNRSALILEINPEPTSLTPISDGLLRGRAGELLPQLVARVQG